MSSLEDLRRELRVRDEIDRRKSQRDLKRYGYRLMPQFGPAPQDEVISRAIAATLYTDRIDRLMVFAPPRHKKSWHCSWFAPSHLMGARKRSRIIHVSHTADLAGQFGRRIRNTINHPKYPWPEVKLATDQADRRRWHTSTGGEYFATGMDNAAAGNPADVMLIDDPLRGIRDADSVVVRDRQWDSYQTDLMTRLEGPQKQVVCLTRWHEDDIPGRILPEDFDGRTGWYRDRETGDPWFVLSLPAVSEHDNDPLGRKVGEWLWPGVHGDGKVIDAARKRGGRTWAALYQQRPSPMEGLYFQESDFRYYDQSEINLSHLRIYGASDYAVTAEAGNNDPDWTVHIVFGVDPSWNVYILDMWRGRTTPDIWVREFLRICKKWKPILWAEEQGQIIKSVGPFLVQQIREQRVNIARRQFTSSVSKEARAASALGQYSMGRMYHPRGAMWLPVFEKELKAFPAGRYDDQVDVVSLFHRMLDGIIAGEVPEEESQPPDNSLEAMFAENERAR